jgi:1,4-dihydroxy-2-naphthoate octaprenyltransferase
MFPFSRSFKNWFIAVRPFAYTASLSSVFLGWAIAFSTGAAVRWDRLLLALVGVVALHTAANLFNDVFDFARGLDSEIYPTSGALVRGLLSSRQVARGAWFFLSIGAAAWLVLAYLTGWPALGLGGLGILLALGYTGRNFGFKYKKLGDVVIFLAFGPIPVIGTYWGQTGVGGWLPALWLWPITLLTVGILHANNWRDLENDIAKNCFTFASTLGRKNSAHYYHALILLPYLLTLLYLILGLLDPGRLKVQPLVLLVFLTLPLALKLLRVRENSPQFNQLDGETAKLQFAFSLMLIVGFGISRIWHFY